MDSEFDLHVSLPDLLLDDPRDRRPWTSEGQKMVAIIANITAESKKAGYNPETDTNWCHLPMELREKCIKEMDFMTRTHMRASSSIEKSYVDAHIYHFDKAIYDSETLIPSGKFLRYMNFPVYTFLKFFKSNPLAPGGYELLVPKLVPIWSNETYANTPPFKFCDFQELECNMRSSFLPDYLDKWVTEGAPFRFKALRCKAGNYEAFEYFLKNSWDGVEEIFLDVDNRKVFCIESIICPSFINAKKVVIEGVPFKNIESFANRIMQIWRERYMVIDSICHLHTGKIEEPVEGEKRSYEWEINKDSKIVMEKNLHGQSGKIIVKVVRNPDPRPTDAPNGN